MSVTTKVRLKKGAKFSYIDGVDKATGKPKRVSAVGPAYVPMTEAQLVAFKDLIAHGPSAEELAAQKAAADAKEEAEAKAKEAAAAKAPAGTGAGAPQK